MSRVIDGDTTLTQLREDGLVPWDWIVDETRGVEDFSGADTVAEDWLRYLPNACLDPWDGNLPFILTESRSLAGVLRPTCEELRVRLAATNGQVGGFLHTKLGPALRPGSPPACVARQVGPRLISRTRRCM
jgi:hypothetical protein